MADGQLYNNISLGGRGGTVSSLSLSFSPLNGNLTRFLGGVGSLYLV